MRMEEGEVRIPRALTGNKDEMENESRSRRITKGTGMAIGIAFDNCYLARCERCEDAIKSGSVE